MLGLLIIGLGLWAVELLLTPYDEFTRSMMEKTGKLHKLEYFRQSLLTPGRHALLAPLVGVLTILLAALGVWAVAKRRPFLAWFYTNYQPLEQAFQEAWLLLVNRALLVKLLFAFVLLAGLGFRLYWGVVQPISYDEAWTYLNFTKNGWLTSLSWYPAPNNHLFYSL